MGTYASFLVYRLFNQFCCLASFPVAFLAIVLFFKTKHLCGRLLYIEVCNRRHLASLYSEAVKYPYRADILYNSTHLTADSFPRNG